MLLLRVCFVSCIIFICVTVFECNNQISDRALERLPFRFGPQSGLLNEWMSWWVHLFLCRSFFYFCFICAFVTFHFHHWISKFSIFFSEYTILCDHAIAPYLHFIMSLFGIHAKSNTFSSPFWFRLCAIPATLLAAESRVLSYFHSGIMCFQFRRTWAIRDQLFSIFKLIC